MLLVAGIRTFVFQSWRIEDDSLSPALEAGDIVIGVPYIMLIRGTPFGITGSPRVGALVLAADNSSTTVQLSLRILDALIRFLSFQQISPVEMRYGHLFGLPYPARVISDIDGVPRKYVVQVTESASGNHVEGLFPTGPIPASALKARLVFRCWPLSRAGFLR